MSLNTDATPRVCVCVDVVLRERDHFNETLTK